MIQNIRKRMKNEKGLTLVELLAVIVILGIIAAIAIPSIGGIIQKSKEDAVKSEALQVLNAAKLYVAAEGIPDGVNKVTLNAGDATKVTGYDANNGDLSPYVEQLQTDSGYVVTADNLDGQADYTINGSGKAGKKTVTFTGATIQDINDNKEGKVDIE